MSSIKKKIIATLILMLWVSFSKAQNQTLDLTPTAGAGPWALRFNDASHVKGDGSDGLDYSDVIGECFLEDDWQASLVEFKNNSLQKFSKMKYNLYTKELHFIDKAGLEISASTNSVKRVIFYESSDTLSEKIALERVTINGEPRLIIELNQGIIKLLKDEIVFLEKGTYNVSLGRQEYRFRHKTDYFLAVGREIFRIMELNKNAIMAKCKGSNKIDDWLKQNRNKLKSEKSVVQFLNYYNHLESTIN